MNYLLLLGDGVELSIHGPWKKMKKVNFSSVKKYSFLENMLHSNWILIFFIGWMGYEFHRYITIHLCCVFMLVQPTTYGGTYHINIKNSYMFLHPLHVPLRSMTADWDEEIHIDFAKISSAKSRKTTTLHYIHRHHLRVGRENEGKKWET